MRGSLSDPNEISDFRWLRENSVDGVPIDCVGNYRFAFNRILQGHKGVIESAIKLLGNDVTFPLGLEPLENYFTGYRFIYVPKTILMEEGIGTEKMNAAGFFVRDLIDSRVIYIIYDDLLPQEIQIEIKVHEIFHFLQSIDPPVLDEYDRVIDHTSLPEKVIVKLLEATTDRATAAYMMPDEYFYKKFRQLAYSNGTLIDVKAIRKMAIEFGVTIQNVTERLKELDTPILIVSK